MTLDGRGERTSRLAARAWWGRVAPGPRTPAELGTMALTSVAIPPLATGHLLRGAWRHRALIRARTYGPEKAERAARTPTPARSQNV